MMIDDEENDEKHGIRTEPSSQNSKGSSTVTIFDRIVNILICEVIGSRNCFADSNEVGDLMIYIFTLTSL